MRVSSPSPHMRGGRGTLAGHARPGRRRRGGGGLLHVRGHGTAAPRHPEGQETPVRHWMTTWRSRWTSPAGRRGGCGPRDLDSVDALGQRGVVGHRALGGRPRTRRQHHCARGEISARVAHTMPRAANPAPCSDFEPGATNHPLQRCAPTEPSTEATRTHPTTLDQGPQVKQDA